MYVPQETLRHLDELAKLDLQDLRDLYFRCLLAATWAVLIGCAMEGPEIACDLWKGFERWRGRSDNDTHHPFWVLILASIGWISIVGGIVGEGIYEALVSSADGSLQTFNDTLLATNIERAANLEAIARGFEVTIAGAQRSTAEAQRDASQANALARTYESSIAESIRRAKTAEAQVASANAASSDAQARVKLAEARIAEAKQKAEEEHLARVKLEELVAWRTVSREQEAKLSARIPPQFIGVKVEITTILGDSEGLQYGTQLGLALKMAGWVIEEPAVTIFRPPPPTGVNVRIGRGVIPAGEILVHVLRSAGLNVTGYIQLPNVQTGQIELVVGVKSRVTTMR